MPPIGAFDDWSVMDEAGQPTLTRQLRVAGPPSRVFTSAVCQQQVQNIDNQHSPDVARLVGVYLSVSFLGSHLAIQCTHFNQDIENLLF